MDSQAALSGVHLQRLNDAAAMSLDHVLWEGMLMPIHDWTRVTAGTFHAFHTAWIVQLQEMLNAGVPGQPLTLVSRTALSGQRQGPRQEC